MHWRGTLLLLLLLLAGCADEANTVPEDLRLPDLTGALVDPFPPDASHVAFIFVRTDCPISNRYAPDMKALASEYGARGVGFWLVYPDPAESPEAISAHTIEYGLTDIGALRDPDHRLVLASGATITPEVAVFRRADRGLVYLGRINDRYVDFGKARPQANVHDLAVALDETLAGNAVTTPVTRAVGCYISGL